MKKNKIYIIILAIILVSVGYIVINKVNKERAIKNYKNEVIELFNENNMSNVEVELIFKECNSFSKFDLYASNVFCDEFEQLTEEQKYSVFSKFFNLDLPDKLKMGILWEERKIYSNGNEYEGTMWGNGGTLYRNGRKFYFVAPEVKSDNYNDTDNVEVSYTLTPTDEEKGFAWAVAKREVKNVLKSPSTAEFPFSYYNETIKKASGDKFQVKSYVEAQNSFGAMVKTNFVVEFERTGEDSYKIITVNLIE